MHGDCRTKPEGTMKHISIAATNAQRTMRVFIVRLRGGELDMDLCNAIELMAGLCALAMTIAIRKYPITRASLLAGWLANSSNRDVSAFAMRRNRETHFIKERTNLSPTIYQPGLSYVCVCIASARAPCPNHVASSSPLCDRHRCRAVAVTGATAGDFSIC